MGLDQAEGGPAPTSAPIEPRKVFLLLGVLLSLVPLLRGRALAPFLALAPALAFAPASATSLASAPALAVAPAFAPALALAPSLALALLLLMLPILLLLLLLLLLALIQNRVLKGRGDFGWVRPNVFLLLRGV